ncbi:MAG: outer membrane beta-barrel protein [Chitinophagaceae bacterium]
MLKFICLLVAFCSFSLTSAFSQSTLSGSLIDSTSQKKLSNAVVALIGVKDSVLYRFVRSDNEGRFRLKDVRPDSFILQVSHPDFGDYVEYLRTSAGKDLSIGNIFVTPKSKLLEEVIVRQNMAIRIKGDTIEYKADSFKTQEGASVKDLLKKFPGITVDKNGKITAQGQDVNKVLVDGEEFFSDDPAVVIENLRADAIDKVQTYDKKSDQAEFSGVDDGTRSKTINLVLKEDKKKGLIGKVVIGGGTEERYSNQAMLNFFKGKQKIAVYGIMSNTGVNGLGWEDRDQFSQGSFDDMEPMPGGGISINSDGDYDFSDWGSQYNGEGIPESIKAGAHYSNKLNQDRDKVNGNYTYKNEKVNAEGNSLSKYILPESAYYNREKHNSITGRTEHNVNGQYDMMIDSMASLRFRFNGKFGNSNSDTRSETETLDNDMALINSNNRRVVTNTDNDIMLGSVLWKQRLKKKGRTISVTASYKENKSNQDGLLFSRIDYYTGGLIYRSDTLDQLRDYFTRTRTLASRAVYTEPIGKRGTLEFNYTFTRTNTLTDRKTFDADGNGKYLSLNDSLSIRYGLEYLNNNAGIKYQYAYKKLTASIGSNAGVSNYYQSDSAGARVIDFRYFNLFPTARISYKFAAQRTISFNYIGSPRPPSINQLAPVTDNTDPLFITLGNPDLKQSFTHNFNVGYNDYKILSGRSIWSYLSYRPQQNAIVSSRTLDNTGKTTQQYINSRGNFSINGRFEYSFKLKKSGINLGVSTQGNTSRYVSMVNGVMNRTTQSSVGIGPTISGYKEDKYEIWSTATYNYNFSKSNTQSLDANFWSQNIDANFSYFFSKRFQMGTSVDAIIRQKTDLYQGNNSVTIWNADMSYKVFKKRNGILKLAVNDLLKDRRGLERNFSAAMISERNYNTLGRYALLSFTWNFVKNPNAPAAK